MAARERLARAWRIDRTVLGLLVHVEDGTQHQLDGSGGWSELVPIFDLQHAVITSATVDQDRTLTLRFSTGARLVAPRNPTGYEAWNVAGLDGRVDVA